MSAPPIPRTHADALHVDGLDLVRFVAAMLVLLYHLTFVEWLSPHSLGAQLFERSAPIPALVHWSWCGWIGVQIFFVISGFVIAFSSVRSTPIAFVRGRFLRLWPALFIASTLSLPLFLGNALMSSSLLVVRYLKDVLFIPVGPWLNGVVWTLGVEIVFYLLVFLLLRARRITKIHRLADGLALWSFGYHVMLFLPDGDPHGPLQAIKWCLMRFPRLTELLLLNHGGFFALGILFFQYYRREFGAARLWTTGLALVACALQIVRTYVWETMDYRSFGMPVHTSIVLPLVVWGGAMLVMLALIASARQRTWFAARPCISMRLGHMTYPLYLAHTCVGLYVIVALRGNGWPPSLVVVVATSAALAVAWLVSRWLEPVVRRAAAGAFDALAVRWSVGSQRAPASPPLRR